MSKVLGILMVTVVVLLLAAVLVFEPLLTIWCLNVLGADIPYELKTWFAALLLNVLVLGSCGAGRS